MSKSFTTTHPAPDSLFAEFNAFLAAQIGLHYPRERWPELAAHMDHVAREFGQADAPACIRWLMRSEPTRGRIEVLASHLTNGETYFFRDCESLKALDERILPELIRLRRKERRLRIWSAGCSTGEEAYSIAILLDARQQELRDWDVAILATDINPDSLRKAAEARYGAWSFRGMPAGIQARCFRKAPDGLLELLPRIQERVTFSYFNLAEKEYRLPGTEIAAIDIILCRNVLMYFEPHAASRVLDRFHHTLAAGGWLIAGAAESSQLQLQSPAWRQHLLSDCTVFRKADGKHNDAERGPSATLGQTVKVQTRRKDRIALAMPPASHTLELSAAGAVASAADPQELYQQGRYAEAASLLETAYAAAGNAQATALLARCHANAGNLTAALAWSHKTLSADKLDSTAHYVHALIETEAGHLADATRSLRRALYLDSDFVLAHIAVSDLARRYGERRRARKHLDIARALLARFAPQDPVPETDGISAGRLTRILASMQESRHEAA